VRIRRPPGSVIPTLFGSVRLRSELCNDPAAQRAKLAADGSALISFETPADEVQALDIPLARR